MSHLPPSPRSTVHRKANRGQYDPASIRAIVDQALLCHIAFNQGGSVHCLPMACWRDGDYLYIHGANNSRLMQSLLSEECALTISHLDGLVLARSAFHHSMNYRSVVIYGRFSEVSEAQAKAAAFDAFIEHVSPGRSAEVRAASPAELAGTRLLRLSLSEAAAKVRNWGVEDSDEDLAIPVWAGVIPLPQRAGTPQPEAGAEQYRLPGLPAFLVV